MRRRWSRTGASVLAAVMLVGVLPVAPAMAQEVRTSGSSRVLGDVRHERLEIRLASGAIARGDVLRFREDDPNIDLRPRLGRGTAVGVQQVVSMAENRLAQGAIAGVNGGYWLPRPNGVPNGLHVTNGRMVAGQAVNRSGNPTGRGMVGIQPSGRMVMDEIRVDLHLDRPVAATAPVKINELNRAGRGGNELLLYDDRYGASVSVPAGATAVVIRGMRIGTSGRTEGDVVAVYRPTEVSPLVVAADRHVLVTTGTRSAALADLAVGELLGVTTAITPKRTAADGWQNLTAGVAGGQLMVQNGERRPASEWVVYAAFGEDHALQRQPRTAIGRTAGGEGLLVTVDGRRAGWSTGLTVRELADTMIALGAVDAVNLDGGGSTTMTVEARIVNRPSEVGRSVADGLFLHAPLPPPNRPLVNACPDGAVPGSGFTDSPGTTHVAAIDCLAWWAVTTGVTATNYAPNVGVTRAQMASFVARWIDGVTARGDGRDLPAAGPLTFQDVGAGSTHAESIARLAKEGILQGRSATSFAPKAVMTRGQTASMLRRAVDYVTATPLPAGRDTFLDDNGSTHEANIDSLAGVGIITGTGGFEFRPQGEVTRGAMAALIMRSSDLVVEQVRTTPPV